MSIPIILRGTCGIGRTTARYPNSTVPDRECGKLKQFAVYYNKDKILRLSNEKLAPRKAGQLKSNIVIDITTVLQNLLLHELYFSELKYQGKWPADQ